MKKNLAIVSLGEALFSCQTGTEKPDEYIIYSAHWDHLGIRQEIDGDSIYNLKSDVSQHSISSSIG